MNCTSKVGQYDILTIKGVHFHTKMCAKSMIHIDYVEAEASNPKITALFDTNEFYALLTCVWLLP